MTGLLFFRRLACDLESWIAAISPGHYYAVPVDDGTAQAFDPGSKINSWGPSILPDGQITGLPVQPFAQKYSDVLFTQITSTSTSSRPHKRDVSRSSRTLRRDAMDAAATQRKHFARTNGADANGEVVWS
jgi:hypothetical protein